MNREQRELIDAVAHGRVYKSAGGFVMRRRPGGQNARCDAKVRELVEAGLVDLGPTALYVLTPAGTAEREASR